MSKANFTLPNIMSPPRLNQPGEIFFARLNISSLSPNIFLQEERQRKNEKETDFRERILTKVNKQEAIIKTLKVKFTSLDAHPCSSTLTF